MASTGPCSTDAGPASATLLNTAARSALGAAATGCSSGRAVAEPGAEGGVGAARQQLVECLQQAQPVAGPPLLSEPKVQPSVPIKQDAQAQQEAMLSQLPQTQPQQPQQEEAQTQEDEAMGQAGKEEDEEEDEEEAEVVAALQALHTSTRTSEPGDKTPLTTTPRPASHHPFPVTAATLHLPSPPIPDCGATPGANKVHEGAAAEQHLKQGVLGCRGRSGPATPVQDQGTWWHPSLANRVLYRLFQSISPTLASALVGFEADCLHNQMPCLVSLCLEGKAGSAKAAAAGAGGSMDPLPAKVSRRTDARLKAASKNSEDGAQGRGDLPRGPVPVMMTRSLESKGKNFKGTQDKRVRYVFKVQDATLSPQTLKMWQCTGVWCQLVPVTQAQGIEASAAASNISGLARYPGPQLHLLFEVKPVPGVGSEVLVGGLRPSVPAVSAIGAAMSRRGAGEVGDMGGMVGPHAGEEAGTGSGPGGTGGVGVAVKRSASMEKLAQRGGGPCKVGRIGGQAAPGAAATANAAACVAKDTQAQAEAWQTRLAALHQVLRARAPVSGGAGSPTAAPLAAPPLLPASPPLPSTPVPAPDLVAQLTSAQPGVKAWAFLMLRHSVRLLLGTRSPDAAACLDALTQMDEGGVLDFVARYYARSVEVAGEGEPGKAEHWVKQGLRSGEPSVVLGQMC